MSVDSAVPLSRRGYLSSDELVQFADITINDADEATDQINQAEELIDSYVGNQDKFLPAEYYGEVQSASSLNLTLDPDHQDKFDKDFFKWCQIEIISGTGEGDRRRITTSTRAGVVTIANAWDTAPVAGSIYKITQVGEFPRLRDVKHLDNLSTPLYAKSIPENIRRAVAAQVQFFIEMGDQYFASDKINKDSERIGNYSYEKDKGGAASGELEKLIAPKARLLLRGYRRRIGQIIP